MTNVTMYRADDGTLFESASECYEYETNHDFFKIFEWFDADGININFKYKYDKTKPWYWIDNNVSDATYCYLTRDLTDKELDYCEQECTTIIPVKKGWNRFDGGQWISKQEEFDDFLKTWKITERKPNK